MKVPAFPKIREELQLEHDSSQQLVRFVDPQQLVRPDLVFEEEFAELFARMDGATSAEQLFQLAQKIFDSRITLRHIVQLIAWLDEELVLDSPAFQRAQRFLQADVIKPVCAGSVYPAEARALAEYLDAVLELAPRGAYPAPRAALIPHIDFRVAAEHYAPVFNALRTAEFDLIIHIGTSHYGWQDRFLLTTKDFLTPLGRIHTDKELVEQLRREVGVPLVRNDLAYQPEHSLELHYVFLQHLFPEREFTVLPVLVTSFHDFVTTGEHPRSDEKFSAFCRALRRVVERSGRKPLLLVSGDLAHIGRRFGDQWDAAPVLDTLRGEDHEVLTAIASGSSAKLFEVIARTGDQRRICGFPPTMTLLEAFELRDGLVLDYGQWNDAPTRSAVSFGSVVWF